MLDVLVIPTRRVSRLEELTPSEVGSLFTSVQTVGKVLEKAYKADALTIACQASARFNYASDTTQNDHTN
jgi:diadenosine tetraphosphate (Ap4A) HIT family hydrolase